MGLCAVLWSVLLWMRSRLSHRAGSQQARFAFGMTEGSIGIGSLSKRHEPRLGDASWGVGGKCLEGHLHASAPLLFSKACYCTRGTLSYEAELGAELPLDWRLRDSRGRAHTFHPATTDSGSPRALCKPSSIGEPPTWLRCNASFGAPRPAPVGPASDGWRVTRDTWWPTIAFCHCSTRDCGAQSAGGFAPPVFETQRAHGVRGSSGARRILAKILGGPF